MSIAVADSPLEIINDEAVYRRASSVTDSSGQSWSIAHPYGATFMVGTLEAADLAYVAHRLAIGQRASAEIDDHEFLVQAEVAMRRASPDLVAALVRFRLMGSRDGIMLLRGMPVDSPLPPTPRSGAFTGSWRELSQSTMSQLMVMSVLGDVISYADEKDGRLVQDICPVPGAEHRQENTGSSLLELHTEDGFHPNKPDFLSLLALRSDHADEAMTVACGIRTVLPQLTPDVVEVLRQPWFRIRLATSFVGADVTAYSRLMPVPQRMPERPGRLRRPARHRADERGGTPCAAGATPPRPRVPGGRGTPARRDADRRQPQGGAWPHRVLTAVRRPGPLAAPVLRGGRHPRVDPMRYPASRVHRPLGETAR